MRAFSNSTVGARGAAVMLAKSVLGVLRVEEGEVEVDDEDGVLVEEEGREDDDDDAAAAAFLSGGEDGVEKCRRVGRRGVHGKRVLLLLVVRVDGVLRGLR